MAKITVWGVVLGCGRLVIEVEVVEMLCNALQKSRNRTSLSHSGASRASPLHVFYIAIKHVFTGHLYWFTMLTSNTSWDLIVDIQGLVIAYLLVRGLYRSACANSLDRHIRERSTTRGKHGHVAIVGRLLAVM